MKALCILRRKHRGAALVEAAIVIPSMLIFVGLIVFTFRSYRTKLDMQTKARAGVLSYASHGCDGSGDVLGDQVFSQSSDDTGLGGDDGVGGPLNQAGQNSGGLDRSWNMVRAIPPSQTIGGKIINGNHVYGVSRKISAESVVACNEKRHDNDFTAVFEFAIDFFQSGAGVID